MSESIGNVNNDLVVSSSPFVLIFLIPCSREVYDFSALKKKSFLARITLPLISAEYKTKITEHCILKAFRKSMEEEEDDASEYHPAWKAPPVRRTFRLDEFFSLCELHRYFITKCFKY